MTEQWDWTQPHGHPEQQVASLFDLPYMTRDSQQCANFFPADYAASYRSHAYDSPASYHQSQPAATNGYELNDHSNSYSSLPSYAQDATSYDHSHVDFSFPVAAEPTNNGLDDFDRRLLASTELPVAHHGLSRRLTLPPRPLEFSYQNLSAQDSQLNAASPSQSLALANSHLNSLFPYVQEPQPSNYVVSSLSGQPSVSRDTQMPVGGHRGLQRPLPSHTSDSLTASYISDNFEDTPRSTLTSLSRSSPLTAQSPSEVVSSRKKSRANSANTSKVSRSQALSSHVVAQTRRPNMQESSTGVQHSGEPPTVQHGIQLVNPRQALPNDHSFKSIFPYTLFNAVQSKCFATVYGTTDNVVVSAPTGSGKTVIFELAICKLRKDKGDAQNFKVIYLAPTKALCQERVRDWEKKFAPMKLQCAELTGDTSQAEMKRVANATIILSTPEKWDSITRKWHDHRKLVELVVLVLVDEVHFLKDSRGSTLEAVVSRMKSIGTAVRFVALSATVPNSQDIAVWLGQSHSESHLPARLEKFGPEFRPVQLRKVVLGFNYTGNDYSFDKSLNTKLPLLLVRHAKGQPTLVFCFTRKSCEETAAALAGFWEKCEDSGKPWQPGGQFAVINDKLQKLVRLGVAYHHAGLDAQDRAAVEKAFKQGDISVICCTSTLAVGVNLPCHTVVLKGTVSWQDGQVKELSDLEVMQMLGRAGRPQFDTSANALILTSARNVEHYEKMVAGHEVLESTLHMNLLEHLNSEIGLKTITDLNSAVRWLEGTFLSVRLQQNPGYYHLTDSGRDAKSQLREICERDIKLLQEAKLITSDEKFKQEVCGKAMSSFMVDFNTMKLLLELPRGVQVEELLNALSKAAVFKDLRFKPKEREMFREVTKSPLIMFPMSEPITQTWHKISLMVQMKLGHVECPDTSDSQFLKRDLSIEQNVVCEALRRLLSCVIECKGSDLDSVSLKSALELLRSVAASAWEDRPVQLQQIHTVGPAIQRKLVAKGIRAVKDLVNKNYGELETLFSRAPPAGKKMFDILAQFPILSMDLSLGPKPRNSQVSDGTSVTVKATLRYLNTTGLPQWAGKVPMVTFLAETSSGVVLYWWRGSLRKLEQTRAELEVLFTAKMEHAADQIHCHLSCEEIVGTMVSKTLSHGIPASVFPVAKRVPVIEVMEIDDYPGELNGGDDELDDEDMLEAAEMAEVSYTDYHGELRGGGDDELDDEDMLEAAEMAEASYKSDCPSVPNGRKSQNPSAHTTTSGEFDPLSSVQAGAPTDEQSSSSRKPASSMATSALRQKGASTKSTELQPMTPVAARKPSTSKSQQAARPTSTAKATTANGSTASASTADLPTGNTPTANGSTAHTTDEPRRMANGKYKCNHGCSERTLQNGKLCKHRCCQEGLEKPPTRPKVINKATSTSKKRKPDDDLGPVASEDESPSSPVATAAPNKKPKSRPQVVPKRPLTPSAAIPSKPAFNGRGKQPAGGESSGMDLDRAEPPVTTTAPNKKPKASRQVAPIRLQAPNANTSSIPTLNGGGNQLAEGVSSRMDVDYADTSEDSDEEFPPLQALLAQTTVGKVTAGPSSAQNAMAARQGDDAMTDSSRVSTSGISQVKRSKTQTPVAAEQSDQAVAGSSRVGTSGALQTGPSNIRNPETAKQSDQTVAGSSRVASSGVSQGKTNNTRNSTTAKQSDRTVASSSRAASSGVSRDKPIITRNPMTARQSDEAVAGSSRVAASGIPPTESVAQTVLNPVPDRVLATGDPELLGQWLNVGSDKSDNGNSMNFDYDLFLPDEQPLDKDAGPYPYGEGLPTRMTQEEVFKRGAHDAMVSGCRALPLPQTLPSPPFRSRTAMPWLSRDSNRGLRPREPVQNSSETSTRAPHGKATLPSIASGTAQGNQPPAPGEDYASHWMDPYTGPDVPVFSPDANPQDDAQGRIMLDPLYVQDAQAIQVGEFDDIEREIYNNLRDYVNIT